jgi:dTDP-4-amino-4,6-dideoxygalactose transaminase
MKKVRLGDLKFSDTFMEFLEEILSSGRVSYGPFSIALENEVAAFHGVNYGVLSSSGTAALQIALIALKIQNDWADDAEVLVPATTFVATINAVIQAGLCPVFVDVHPEYFDINLNIQNAKQFVTDKTVAIVPVGLFGQTYDMEAVDKVAKQFDLKVVHDFCEGIGVRHNEEPIGPYADVTCFSFYIAHIVQGGVGGLGITDDEELATLMRSLVNHGRRLTDTVVDGKKVELTARFTFDYLGYSYRITEFEAALALAEFCDMLKNIEARQRIVSLFMNKLLPFSDFIKLPTKRPESGHCWMALPLVIVDSNIEKLQLCSFLEERGIETRDTLPILGQPVANKYYGLAGREGEFPVSANMVQNAFYISCSNHLTEEDVDYVAEVFAEWAAQYRTDN